MTDYRIVFPSGATPRRFAFFRAPLTASSHHDSSYPFAISAWFPRELPDERYDRRKSRRENVRARVSLDDEKRGIFLGKSCTQKTMSAEVNEIDLDSSTGPFTSLRILCLYLPWFNLRAEYRRFNIIVTVTKIVLGLE